METMIKWLAIAFIFLFVSMGAMVVSENLSVGTKEAQADPEPRYYQLMERQTRALEDIARTLSRIKDCGCRP